MAPLQMTLTDHEGDSVFETVLNLVFRKI